MKYYDDDHKKAIDNIDKIWESLQELNNLAKTKGIVDIFQDNGAKILQQLIYLNFKSLPKREGNDAVDVNGVEWEMKSINIATSASGFSTNHHTNRVIIKKYRKVPWSFAIYDDIDLLEIYVMTPDKLEPLFLHWEKKLETMSHLNNPKISIKYVRENGILVYSEGTMYIDPSSITEDF